MTILLTIIKTYMHFKIFIIVSIAIAAAIILLGISAAICHEKNNINNFINNHQIIFWSILIVISLLIGYLFSNKLFKTKDFNITTYYKEDYDIIQMYNDIDTSVNYKVSLDKEIIQINENERERLVIETCVDRNKDIIEYKGYFLYVYDEKSVKIDMDIYNNNSNEKYKK